MGVPSAPRHSEVPAESTANRYGVTVEEYERTVNECWRENPEGFRPRKSKWRVPDLEVMAGYVSECLRYQVQQHVLRAKIRDMNLRLTKQHLSPNAVMRMAQRRKPNINRLPQRHLLHADINELVKRVHAAYLLDEAYDGRGIELSAEERRRLLAVAQLEGLEEAAEEIMSATDARYSEKHPALAKLGSICGDN